MFVHPPLIILLGLADSRVSDVVEPWKHLHQKAYINKVLERFRMEDCSILVSIGKSDKFNLDQFANNEFERKQMKNISSAFLVGNFMYNQFYRRPYITLLLWLKCLGDNKSIYEWHTRKLQRKC